MVMLLTLGVVTAALGTAVGAIFRGLQKAPEAYEDERGLNIIQQRARISRIVFLKHDGRALGSASLKQVQVQVHP